MIGPLFKFNTFYFLGFTNVDYSNLTSDYVLILEFVISSLNLLEILEEGLFYALIDSISDFAYFNIF